MSHRAVAAGIWTVGKEALGVTVEIDLSKLGRLVVRAAKNKTKKATTGHGAVVVVVKKAATDGASERMAAD